MKIYLTLLVFAFLICSLSLYGQHLEPQPGDNIILIKANHNQDSIYTAIGRTLVESGFALNTSNKEFMQITTTPKILDQAADIRYAVVITIDDEWIKITPTMHTQQLTVGAYQWYYRKSKSASNSIVLSDIQKTFSTFGQLHYNKI